MFATPGELQIAGGGGSKVNSRLLIPVYLNQRIVFDLLAMLEGGIARVTRVISSDETEMSRERRFGAEFGLSKALSSLLRIDVSGDLRREEGSVGRVESDEERIHTPASLFFRLRQRLFDEEAVARLDDNSRPKVQDLVEFTASLSRNPIVETMDSIISLMDMAVLFEASIDGHQRPSKNTAKSKRQPRGSNSRHDDDPKKMLEQMRAFRERLMAGDTVDVVANGIAGDLKAVITLDMEYLNDPTMADLVDGRFNVLGKITRVAGKGEPISLLRKTALQLMPAQLLTEFMASFEQLSRYPGINLPELVWEVEGPALQIIPIAIFA